MGHTDTWEVFAVSLVLQLALGWLWGAREGIDIHRRKPALGSRVEGGCAPF